ncbi:MAG TPA: hypothetical protein VK752_24450 [Bryobacteraceae bacterium]|jgi:hypothetical protein|nr:hypothetical protein [Bryobacteraceae bacterium]
MNITRRTFLGTAAALPALAQARPKRVAIITTIFRLQSHGQHIGDRFIVGYPFAGEWHKPDTQVVSLYVDQKPAGDLSEARAKEFGFKVYPTIAETVCCGGSKLAVDAVLIIGEHGDYPHNEKGQVLYPRFEFFEQVAKVFESEGRSVPVYNDKHLSYSFEKAKRMRDTSHRLKFPMLAGSSLPVTWRLPDLELPLGCEIEDALMVGCGGSDAMDFHALEAMQCMLERRKGGESGVKSVQLIEGDDVWKDARWSKEMLRSALSRSDNLKGATVTDGRTQDMVGTGVLPGLVKNPWAYFIEYRDGTKATMLMLSDAVGDFTFAVKLKGKPIQSTQFFLSPDPNVTYSACLAHKIEQMIMTGNAPYPVERTLLVSGMLESCLDSRVKGHVKMDTPHLAVTYQAPRESQYCRI